MNTEPVVYYSFVLNYKLTGDDSGMVYRSTRQETYTMSKVDAAVRVIKDNPDLVLYNVELTKITKTVLSEEIEYNSNEARSVSEL